MALSCGGKTLKYTLFAFNFVFWLTGLVLVALGLWILLDSHATQYLHVQNLGYESIRGAAITIVVVGVLIFLVSWLGCCGACTESKGCLTGFAAFLVFIMLLQLVAIILAAVLHNKVEDELRSEMNATIQYYGNTNYTATTEGWNFLQIKMKCCGVTNLTDWINTPWYETNVDEVPASCCVDLKDANNYSNPIPTNATACYNAAFDSSVPEDERIKHVNIKGCETGLKDWFISKLGVFIAIVAIIIFIQVAVVVLSCFLKRKITAYEYV